MEPRALVPRQKRSVEVSVELSTSTVVLMGALDHAALEGGSGDAVRGGCRARVATRLAATYN